MSSLRYSSPGSPTTLVDLGPAVGRTSHTRGAVTGGALVVAGPPSKRGVSMLSERRKAQVAAAHARYEERRRVTVPCGRWIILSRDECGRTKGHVGSCATKVRMARLAAERRTR